MRTVAGGERMEDILSSQTSNQEDPFSKFSRILSTAIMGGLDSIDFSYYILFLYIYSLSLFYAFLVLTRVLCFRECGLFELPVEIGTLKHLVKASGLQHKAPLVPQLKIFLG